MKIPPYSAREDGDIIMVCARQLIMNAIECLSIKSNIFRHEFAANEPKLFARRPFLQHCSILQKKYPFFFLSPLVLSLHFLRLCRHSPHSPFSRITQFAIHFFSTKITCKIINSFALHLLSKTPKTTTPSSCL